MENMPLIIAAAIGGLLIIVVVLYVLSQKKQDRKETENSQIMLEDLKIDMKDASEDIEEAVAEEIALVADTDQARSVRKADVPKPKLESVKTDLIDLSAHVEPAKSKTAEATESVDEFELMDNQNELVLEMSDDELPIGNNRTFSDKNQVKVVKQPEIDPDSNLGNLEIDLSEETDMSELDALFEASTDVEEMVLSGQKSSMFDPDAPFEDSAEGDLIQIELDQPISAVIEEAPKVEKVSVPITREPVKKDQPAEQAALDPEELARHEKAKRIARVIVNDIRNYNPDNLAEGIRIGSIMKTLGKEVERGRLLYIKRVPPEIAKETNYYRDALIKILADGQPGLLGF